MVDSTFVTATGYVLMKLEQLLDRYAAAVSTDNAFQRRARLLQSLWREDRQLPIGERRPGVPLGSRLPLPFAQKTLANFLTDNIRGSVRECIDKKAAGSGQLVEETRLYANLLSSQPLCFNLFGELHADLRLASLVCGEVWPDRVQAVTAIRFEHSPGRGAAAFTGDRSAFDVFIEHTIPKSGGRGFIGVEVKYHENLKVAPAAFRPRYDELAATMGCFSAAHLPVLRQAPLEQIWRDHLLAGSMLATNEWAAGLYVFLHPQDNPHCARVAETYARCLTEGDTFEAVTLERFIEATRRHTNADWMAELHRRYLGWERIDELLSYCELSEAIGSALDRRPDTLAGLSIGQTAREIAPP